jgi:hypothetical protein
MTKRKMIWGLILMFAFGCVLFGTLPNDNRFHVQGVLAALLGFGSIVSLLIVAIHQQVVDHEMERRRLGWFAKLSGQKVTFMAARSGVPSPVQRKQIAKESLPDQRGQVG